MRKFILIFTLILYSCIEQIDVGPELNAVLQLKGALVVEANITNLEKRHQVFLSRVRRIESDSTVNVTEDVIFNPNTPISNLTINGLGVDFESNANVKLVSDNGLEFDFEEVQDGTYQSSEIFAVQPNIEYQLLIRTEDGEEYLSEKKRLLVIQISITCMPKE